MRKFAFVLIALTLAFAGPLTVVSADPGPYGATLSVDGCDGTPDGIATPCEAGNAHDVYNAINHVFTSAGFASPGLTSNEDTDAFQFTSNHEYWNDISGPTNNGFARISVTAGNNNTLGLFPKGAPGSAEFFPPAVTGTTFLGTGTALDPYPGALNPFAGDFGFALKTVGGGTTIWYSDPLLNSDGIDHMIAYYLPDLEGADVWIEVDTNDDDILDSTVKIKLSKETYLLAWEDRGPGLTDEDYNDSIQLVTRVVPIPEPMTMMLMGSGLVGLVGLRKKKRA